MADQEKKQKERKRVLRDLRKRYRLLVINDQTFEERLSIRLSPLNVLLLVASTFFIVAAITLGIIFFTPLSEVVPGHTDEESWRNTMYAASKADSLSEKLRVYKQYVDHRTKILNGETINDSAGMDAGTASSIDDLDLDPSLQDSLFREKQGKAEAYNILQEQNADGSSHDLSSVFFFTPVRGVISSSFDPVSDHLGIDVVAPKDEAIKAALDGTIILSTWTSSAGYVIQIQHENDLITVYKHNSVLLKKQGAKVKAGEAIAVIGDTGELTDGPHLHFELWYKGEAINPVEHMVFD